MVWQKANGISRGAINRARRPYVAPEAHWIPLRGIWRSKIEQRMIDRAMGFRVREARAADRRLKGVVEGLRSKIPRAIYNSNAKKLPDPPGERARAITTILQHAGQPALPAILASLTGLQMYAVKKWPRKKPESQGKRMSSSSSSRDVAKAGTRR